MSSTLSFIEHMFGILVLAAMMNRSGGESVMRGYGDELEVQLDDEGRPLSFQWRGRRYQVKEHLARWQARSAWWKQPGVPSQLEDSVWRVEAAAGSCSGVFDLRAERLRWSLLGVVD